MMKLEGISKSYGHLQVLHDVSLEIPQGEIMAIVGPSGAGKTTLLQIAGTLDRPDKGVVRWDDIDLLTLGDKKLSAFRNRHIGFVFQFHQLLPEFSALENTALPSLIAGSGRKEAFDRAKSLLTDLGLGGRLDHKPAELSGGERQRTAIARAMINSPGIIFADEPTGSLDSSNRREIQETLIRLRREKGQTFVVVTHDEDMASIADRVIYMADGRVVRERAIREEEDIKNMSGFA